MSPRLIWTAAIALLLIVSCRAQTEFPNEVEELVYLKALPHPTPVQWSRRVHLAAHQQIVAQHRMQVLAAMSEATDEEEDVDSADTVVHPQAYSVNR